MRITVARALPAHSRATIEFDLFILKGWTGNANPADVWDLSVANGPDLLRTSFANPPLQGKLLQRQAFPDLFPGGTHAPQTGAIEKNTLGYRMDAVYHLVLPFPHAASSLTFNFRATLPVAQGATWGLDGENVRALIEHMVHKQGLKDRVTIDHFTGDMVTAKSVLDYYDRLDTNEDEALVFYFSGHGGYDKARGHVMAFTRVFAGADYTSITSAEPALAIQVPNPNPRRSNCHDQARARRRRGSLDPRQPGARRPRRRLLRRHRPEERRFPAAGPLSAYPGEVDAGSPIRICAKE